MSWIVLGFMNRHFIEHTGSTCVSHTYPVLQVEREKTALLMNLQESQTQLQHTQGALSEQHERVHRLTERINTMKCLNGDKELDDPQESEKADGGPSSPPSSGHQDPDINGFEILACKYKVAMTEVIDLKAELKALKEKYNQAVEGQGESHSDDRVRALSEQVLHVVFIYVLPLACGPLHPSRSDMGKIQPIRQATSSKKNM